MLGLLWVVATELKGKSVLHSEVATFVAENNFHNATD